jgi:hypothetical protein
MSSAEEAVEEAVPEVENVEADNGGSDNKKANGGTKKNFRKEPEVPIEELYDLTKPIPRVSRYVIWFRSSVIFYFFVVSMSHVSMIS